MLKIVRVQAIWCSSCLYMSKVWDKVMKNKKDIEVINLDYDLDRDIIKEGMNRAISISADSICIGKESSEAGSVDTHAAYGERVEEALEEIYNIFTRMYAATAPSPYTNPISNILTTQMLAPLSSKISKITSQDVKIV